MSREGNHRHKSIGKKLLLVVALLTGIVAPSQASVGVCDPERPFCGRLFIVFASAGERLGSDNTPNSDGSLNRDSQELDAYSIFMQFRRQSGDGLPSRSVVISSDPQLAAKLSALPEAEKRKSGFLGVAPASIQTFREFLSDEQSSLLTQAIKQMEADSGCKKMKEYYRTDSVLPFLMVQLNLLGENSTGSKERGEPSFALWSSKETVGPYAKWKANSARDHFDQSLASQFMDKLRGAAFQILPYTCKGAKFGAWFQKDGVCSTYLSSSDSVQLDYGGGGEVNSPWAYLLPNKGKEVEASQSASPGAASLVDMIGGSFQKYEATYDHSMYSEVPHTNPLSGYIYSSVDGRCDKVLNAVLQSHALHDAAKRLQAASFTAEFRSQPNESALQSSAAKPTVAQLIAVSSKREPISDGAFQVLEKRRDEYKSKFHNILNEQLTTPNLSRYKHGFNSFLACLDINNPRPESCRILRTNNYSLLYEEKIALAFGTLVETIEAEELYTLISQYEKGDVDISGVFKSFKILMLLFEEFRTSLEIAATVKYKGRPFPKEFQIPFDHMSDSFEFSFYSVKNHLFRQLRKEIIKVRLAKLDAAIYLLKIKATDRRDEDMNALSNELAGMTEFPVGPAFDKKYGDRMKEFMARVQKQPSVSGSAPVR